jgi:hypothetical protein
MADPEVKLRGFCNRHGETFGKSLKAGRWNPLFLYPAFKNMIYGKAHKLWRYLEMIEQLVGTAFGVTNQAWDTDVSSFACVFGTESVVPLVNAALYTYKL